MASGENLYSGDMFQAMIEKLDQTITALNNVNMTVSQQVTTMKCKASDNITIAIENAETSCVMPSGTTGASDSKVLAQFNCYQAGTIKVKARIKATWGFASSVAFNVYSGASGSTAFSTAPVIINKVDEFYDIFAEGTVAVNDIVKITMTAARTSTAGTASSPASITLEANSLNLCYDMVDIVALKGMIRTV